MALLEKTLMLDFYETCPRSRATMEVYTAEIDDLALFMSWEDLHSDILQ